MNFEQAMEDRINQMKEVRLTELTKAKLALVNRDDIVIMRIDLTELNKEIKKLNSIISQLNLIKPFVAKDGRRFRVNVFSQVSNFGPGLGQLIGIIQGAKSAFTDEMALEYEAITGVPYLELVMCADALGSADYYNVVTNEIKFGEEGDMKKFIPLLLSIEARMGLSMVVPDSDDDIINAVAKWQMKAIKRSRIKQKESKLSDNLDTDSFVLED